MTRLVLASCPHLPDPVGLGRLLRDAGHEVVHAAGADARHVAATAVQEDVRGVLLAVAPESGGGDGCPGLPDEVAGRLADAGADDVAVLAVLPEEGETPWSRAVLARVEDWLGTGSPEDSTDG